jgi:hypothetical protein
MVTQPEGKRENLIQGWRSRFSDAPPKLRIFDFLQYLDAIGQFAEHPGLLLEDFVPMHCQCIEHYANDQTNADCWPKNVQLHRPGDKGDSSTEPERAASDISRLPAETRFGRIGLAERQQVLETMVLAVRLGTSAGIYWRNLG